MVKPGISWGRNHFQRVVNCDMISLKLFRTNELKEDKLYSADLRDDEEECKEVISLSFNIKWDFTEKINYCFHCYVVMY